MLFSLMIRRCYKLLRFGILRFHTRFRFFLLKITIVPPYHWPIAMIRYCFWRLENILNGIQWSMQIRSKLKHVSVGKISVCGQPNLINQLLWCATPPTVWQNLIRGHVLIMNSWSANENITGKKLRSASMLFYYHITNVKLSGWLI